MSRAEPTTSVTADVTQSLASTLSVSSLSPSSTNFTFEIRSSACIIPWTSLEFGELLGSGGFGQVHRARYRHADVAVKVLHATTPSEVQAFIEEISLLSNLRHPNIVFYIGVTSDADTGVVGAVTEFLPGGDLHTLLYSRGGRGARLLDAMQFRVQILADVAKGLDYLHTCSPPVPHRDIKPSNILLTENLRTAKLADLGLSGDKGGRAAGAGTTRYCAPEVLLCEEATTASDVFSFGLVMFEVLTRARPFHDVDRAQNIYAGPGPLPDNTPPALVMEIRASWNPEPTHRPRAVDIVEVLRSEAVATMGQKTHTEDIACTLIQAAWRGYACRNMLRIRGIKVKCVTQHMIHVLPHALPHWEDPWCSPAADIEILSLRLDLWVTMITQPTPTPATRELTAAMLLTHASYVSTALLLDFFALRFSCGLKHQEGPDNDAIFESTVRPLICLRVLAILREWIEEYYYDFASDPRAAHHLQSFVIAVGEGCPVPMITQANQTCKPCSDVRVREAAVTLHNILNSKKEAWSLMMRSRVLSQLHDCQSCHSRECKDCKSLSRAPPFADVPECIDTIADIDPVEVARQITIRDHDIYVRISPSELLGRRWKHLGGYRSCNVVDLKKRFRGLSELVATSVVSLQTAAERMRLLCFWLDCCKALLRMRNLGSALAIAEALKNSAVSRLDLTIGLLPPAHAALLTEVQSLISRDTTLYDGLLASASPPFVPCIALHMTRCANLSKQGPLTSGRRIRVNAQLSLTRNIQETLRGQSAPYLLRPHERLSTYLKAQPRSNAKTCYALSLQAEARGKKMKSRRKTKPKHALQEREELFPECPVGSSVAEHHSLVKELRRRFQPLSLIVGGEPTITSAACVVLEGCVRVEGRDMSAGDFFGAECLSPKGDRFSLSIAAIDPRSSVMSLMRDDFLDALLLFPSVLQKFDRRFHHNLSAAAVDNGFVLYLLDCVGRRYRRKPRSNQLTTLPWLLEP